MSDAARLHASAVGWDGRGLLITGPSGSGKSTLALQLMALGAVLVADDQVVLSQHTQSLWAEAPGTIAGLIEARGTGVLKATSAPARIVAVVDLSKIETERLPHLHNKTILGVRVPCLHKVDSPAWPAALLQYLKAGRRDPA